MATPIAHKGAITGAKVMAATVIDLLATDELLKDAWTYFRQAQTKDKQYEPFITKDDPPATEKNRKIMDEFKDRLETLYYDPAKYETYLLQLGIEYPSTNTP